jgi:hypothetical protein
VGTARDTHQPAWLSLIKLLQIFFGSFSTAAAQLGMPSPQTGDQLFRAIGPKRLSLVFATALISIPAWAIQDAVAALPSRLTATIPTRQKIFISNTSDGEGLVLEDAPAWTYNRFYAAMQILGRYQILDRPAGADLIFEVNYREPWEFIMPKMLYPFTPVKDPCNPYQDYHDYLPKVSLDIWDARHSILLGSYTQPIKPDPTWIDSLELHLQENLDTAIATVIDRAERAVGHPSISVDLPKKINDAPVSPLLAGGKVFLSPPAGAVAGSAELYAAVLSSMKRWGHFVLVSDVEDADLVFDLSLLQTSRTIVETRPKEPGDLTDRTDCPYHSTVITLDERQIRLQILVPHTRIVLWGFFQPLGRRILTSTWERSVNRVAKSLDKQLHHVVQRAESGWVRTVAAESNAP